MEMATKPFFEDAESSYFDNGGMPTKPGIYEFRCFDGRKIIYTLDFMEPEEDRPPRLKVVRASSMAHYPYPAHALNTLDGDWVRFLGLPAAEENAAKPDGEAAVKPAGESAAESGPGAGAAPQDPPA